MTAAREAVTLPLIFLTVLLAGGTRAGTPFQIVPPSVFTLVLGLLFLRVVVQSGTLAPNRLVSGARHGLANANGVVVLVTLWLAAAQTMSLMLPESGLPRVACGFFLFVLLLNTAAAEPNRARLLRSLAVTFGSAFLLKFVVLAAISTPADGRLKQFLQSLADSITLGVLMQPPVHALAGYIALFVVLLFLTGVLLLPARAATPGLVRQDGSSGDLRISE